MKNKITYEETKRILNKCDVTMKSYIARSNIHIDDNGLFDINEVHSFKRDKARGITTDESGKRWITKSGAATLLGIGNYSVSELFKNVEVNINGRVKYPLDDIEEYERMQEERKIYMINSLFGKIKFQYHEYCLPFDPFNNPKTKDNPIEYQTSQRYVVTNLGNIFNLDRCEKLKCSPATHGYLQVALAQCNQNTFWRVHRLVAYLFCDNGKYKPEVHHINGVRTDNRAVNLVFATKEEHDKADSLLKKAKDTKPGSDEWKEYNTYIDWLRNDNKLSESQIKANMRWIPADNDNFVLMTDYGYNWLQTKKPEVREKMLDYAVRLTKEDNEAANETNNG